MTKRDFDATHAKILQSGLAFFLKQGYEKANLRAICKNAGVTTGAFYKHFEDKEALFDELVAPLASRIDEIYEANKEKSFQVYGEASTLSRERVLHVLQMKEKATVETLQYFYSQKDLFELLIFKAYGTRYENFLDKIIELEDQNDWKVLQMIHGPKKAQQVMSPASVHMINHAFFNALSQSVVHARNEAELLTMAQTIAHFFTEGWKKYRGL